MSRRNTIIIVLTIIFVMMGVLIFWYSSTNKNISGTTGTSGSTTSPFGNTSGNKFVSVINSTTTEANSQSGQSGQENSQKPLLIQIYKNPVSGDIFFANKSGQDVLRFIDRAVGNAYEYVPASNTAPMRLTNTTIPKIEEAVWSSNGENVLLRTLENDSDNISTFSGKINPAGTSSQPGEMAGTFLASNITEAAINPSGNRVFELNTKPSGAGSFGITAIFDGSNKKQVFDSPITYWNISWPNDSLLAFNTKPSSDYSGYLFFFNMQTGSMSEILGNMAGLSTVTNSDASMIAYSQSQDNGFSLNIYDNKKKIAENISLPTLADKCIWGSKDNTVLYCAVPISINPDKYPDSWYQGSETFSDDIWKIDAQKQEISLVYQIGSSGADYVDATDLKISPDDNYLAFTNKKDLSLWVLNVSGASSAQ